LTGTQGPVSNFIQFTITYLSGCSTASAIAPLPASISVAVKVSDPVLTIPISGFTSSIIGCESLILYSCPDCPSSLVFTFSSPNLMIQAIGNDAVGNQ
jgi:hypothetical protein